MSGRANSQDSASSQDSEDHAGGTGGAGGSGAEAAAAPSLPPRVDFYVLAAADARGRARLACRLVEKAYGEGQRVLVWLEGPAELASFDELLWTFADRSFVPHEPYSDAQQWRDTPVLLSCPAGAPQLPASEPAAPGQRFELLLNLASEVPTVAAWATRILEVIDSDPARLQSGRHRFRHYRDRGLNPQTHHIAADEAP